MTSSTRIDNPRKSASQGGTLVSQVGDHLRSQIVSGKLAPGDRLPTETQLTKDFSVSRTVIREAVATLRAEGLLEARQGSGVYVMEGRNRDSKAVNSDPNRLSSVIENLELRCAIESDAAYHAAIRRTPADEETILFAMKNFEKQVASNGPTAQADFDLHLAISDACGNPKFSDYLRTTGHDAIPRHKIGTHNGADSSDYQELLLAEHQAIVSAILLGDGAAASAAMRNHLHNSQTRYRKMLLEIQRD